jgi:hypothetical protein
MQKPDTVDVEVIAFLSRPGRYASDERVAADLPRASGLPVDPDKRWTRTGVSSGALHALPSP